MDTTQKIELLSLIINSLDMTLVLTTKEKVQR